MLTASMGSRGSPRRSAGRDLGGEEGQPGDVDILVEVVDLIVGRNSRPLGRNRDGVLRSRTILTARVRPGPWRHIWGPYEQDEEDPDGEYGFKRLSEKACSEGTPRTSEGRRGSLVMWKSS